MTNLSFVLPELHYIINIILKTEKMLQFGTKSSRRAWHVVLAQEANGRYNVTGKFAISRQTIESIECTIIDNLKVVTDIQKG